MATLRKVWNVLIWLHVFDHMKMVIIYYDLIVIDFHLFWACVLPFDHDSAFLGIGINILSYYMNFLVKVLWLNKMLVGI